MARIAIVCLLLSLSSEAQTTESCKIVHGRARLYCADGQLRIWHVGTHHDYTPDESSWENVVGWLKAGVKPREDNACLATDLYADFLICPTEPFKKGAVQRAKVKAAYHRHYVPWD
jgi:hypothetical protein